MKQNVRSIKNLEDVLPYIRDKVMSPQKLFSGGKPEKFDLLHREILINWIFCAIWNHLNPKDPLTFSNDPSGSDGCLIYRNTLEGEVTEHVMAYEYNPEIKADAEDVVINAIMKKQEKGGKAYAEGKHLMIFCEAIGEWCPNKVVRKIKGNHDFRSVWAIGLKEVIVEKTYLYWMTNLGEEDYSNHILKINFEDMVWDVE